MTTIHTSKIRDLCRSWITMIWVTMVKRYRVKFRLSIMSFVLLDGKHKQNLKQESETGFIVILLIGPNS